GNATAGISGASDLVTLQFKTIAAGEAPVELIRVKAVNKNVESFEIENIASVSVSVSNDISFNDVSAEYWTKANIDREAALGFITGYSDGMFKPLQSVTRAEYVTMLSRGLQLEIDDVNSVLPFKDADKIGGWASASIAKASELG